jgi:hypothetical protein
MLITKTKGDKTMNWKPKNVELSVAKTTLSNKFKFVLQDFKDEDISMETFLACQQIIHNSAILDMIRLVLSGQFSEFLDELDETLFIQKDQEEIDYQPYDVTVTKDMFRFVTGGVSYKELDYIITERGQWFDSSKVTWNDYRIDHDYMFDFMHKLEEEIENLPAKYRDCII